MRGMFLGALLILLGTGFSILVYVLLYLYAIQPLLMMSFQTVCYLSFVIYQVFVVEPNTSEIF